MIGLGSQYLTAAGFGRYRITAASLGNLFYRLSSWLMNATMQAILGAFGDDGMAAINATNEYLNGIAASDRDKATALAGFINEDPMMVCSLGLEVQGVTMPIRCVVGGSGKYFNLGIVPNSNTQFLLAIVTPATTASWEELIGERSSNMTADSVVIRTNGNTMQYGANTYFANCLTFTNSTYYELEWSIREFKVNGSITNRSGKTELGATTRPMFLCYQNNDAHGYFRGGVNRLIVTGDEGKTGWFLPTLNNGVVELVNVETGNFATRIGTFTEAFYLPDGTPWTPSTP